MLLLTFCFRYPLKDQLPTKQGYWISASLSLVIVSLSGLLWFNLKGEHPISEAQATQPSFSELMTQKQTILTENPNSAKDWFELGEMYMQQNEFDSAHTCFDYAIRLTKVPYASQFSALATASYYHQGQNITPDVRRLLDKTLEMDPFNQTALQLIAADHFISGDYQQAIDVWTMVLDSNRLGINRVKLINSINQAKGFIRN